ncbi:MULTISPECIES: type II toxin-antitoxin system MqsR family toxin [Aeromonas]|uniref:type II toxin-antitoxin system MqsR family toxin n=2 Tax=Aeromonas TaxID=642 RepID=UPI002B25531C|nr:type II toxin-antitoxin system MqsR family toxin [Aeromonas caviae]MEA9419908.1 type II toxin-antitoxin system MqsR family toxin [Aeromonas caviae]
MTNRGFGGIIWTSRQQEESGMTGTSYTNPTFNLSSIKNEFNNISKLRTTLTARKGYTELGFSDQDVVDAISSIDESEFHKTMPSNAMPGYSFDVYKTTFKGKKIYVKFQNINGFIVVSFKEDTSI